MNFPSLNINKFIEQLAGIKVSSVVDSLFKYVLLIFVFPTVILIWAPQFFYIACVLYLIGIIMIIFGIYIYRYFAMIDPDYLRSEDYNLRKRSIEILGDKDKYLPVDSKDIVSITKPDEKIQRKLSGRKSNIVKEDSKINEGNKLDQNVIKKEELNTGDLKNE